MIFGGKWKISGIGEMGMTNFVGFWWIYGGFDGFAYSFLGFFSSVAGLTLNSSETTTT